MHFIRHGQSHFNLAHDRLGSDPNLPDAGLTPHGMQQAQQAAHQLAGKGITRLIVSPYTRALQTATIIAEHLKIGIHVEPLVGERALFSCDIGTPRSLLQSQWPKLDFAALEAEQWWPEQGETHRDVGKRAALFQEKWCAQIGQGDHALVSHWYFLNTITDHDFANCEILHHPLP